MWAAAILKFKVPSILTSSRGHAVVQKSRHALQAGRACPPRPGRFLRTEKYSSTNSLPMHYYYDSRSLGQRRSQGVVKPCRLRVRSEGKTRKDRKQGDRGYTDGRSKRHSSASFLPMRRTREMMHVRRRVSTTHFGARLSNLYPSVIITTREQLADAILREARDNFKKEPERWSIRIPKSLFSRPRTDFLSVFEHNCVACCWQRLFPAFPVIHSCRSAALKICRYDFSTRDWK
jgi:hypothetical protein